MKFKEFWQRYKGEVGKLYTTRLALAVFSIVCISPLMVLDVEGNESSINTILLLASIAVFAFYYFLIHSQLWTVGAKNKISADGGRMKLNPLAGLYIGLFSAIPGAILNIVYIATWFYKDYAGYKSVNQIAAIIEFLWDAPALGLRFVFDTPFAYLASTLLPVLFAALSYYLGTKEFKLFRTSRKEE